MRKTKLVLALLLIFSIMVTGCGKKDANDVVSDLKNKMDSLDSYKAIGTMKINAGDNPQVYSVEVWYKTPHYYRIELNNVESKVTQIVLRNDDGVFVLDPALNKSYRFKSDWPESNGAVYLFQSLAASIIDDTDRLFTADKDMYLFEVKANYQNQTLTKQKVWLDKKARPMKVAVFDPNETQLVEMEFTSFEFGSEFDKDSFDMERNLSSFGVNSLPAMNTIEPSDSFGFIEPAYIPEGISKNSPKFVSKEEGDAVVIKYMGQYNYNIVETRAKSIMTTAPEASKTDIVNLGFGIGILNDMTDMRSLTWTYDGVDFKLTGDLPVNEMITVAKSVLGQAAK